MCAIRRLFRMSLDDDLAFACISCLSPRKKTSGSRPQAEFPEYRDGPQANFWPGAHRLARAGGLHSCTIEVLDQRGIADRFPVRYRKTLSLSPQLLLGDQALDEFGPFL